MTPDEEAWVQDTVRRAILRKLVLYAQRSHGQGTQPTMASKKVHLPDGSEEDAAEIICEDCDKPVSQHTCVNGAAGSGGGGGTGRSTGPRKDPRARPQCPHCGGAVHFSMPGGLQNTECIMRQYYIDKGDIVDAYATLPLYGLDELGEALDWARDLKTPITYGRMDSAAGGAGTYAALRPKADKTTAEKRPRKQKAAAAGERIEDMAKEVAPAAAVNGTAKGKGKPGRKPKAKPAAAAPAAQVQAPTAPSVKPDATAAAAAKQQEAEDRRAKRRALLGIGR